jgi:DNA-binding beta-propeller fold protein YncE
MTTPHEPEALYVTVADTRYRVDRPWGTLPDGIALENPGHVAVDSNDNVYVYQRSNPPVIVFGPDGTYLRSWGDGQLVDAHGIFITSDDRVWLVDRDAHQVLCFDTQGNLEMTLGERGYPWFQQPFNHPTGVAVAVDGDIYVTDGYANARVHRFSSNGEHILSWGEPGRGTGEFRTPHAVLIDRRNRVLVLDRDNDRIQIFTRDGEYITEWPDFVRPMDIHQDTAGLIYVSDQVPRMSVLDDDGNLIDRCRPVLTAAHGISGDSRGNIFLAELTPRYQVTRLTPARARIDNAPDADRRAER